MVSWTNLFTNDPVGGMVVGYNRLPLSGGSPVWSGNSGSAWLRSPGSVDLNFGTRLQSVTPEGTGGNLTAYAALIYDAADVAAYPGKRLGATVYIAPDGIAPPFVVPNPGLIKANAIMSQRVSVSRTTAGSVKASTTFSFSAVQIQPNQKFWIAVIPTAFDEAQPLSSDTPVGDVNVNGRGLSYWTNRTPQAPVVTSPVAKTTLFPGSTIDFMFSPRDPDRIATFPGDQGINDFDDMAGVQVQYRPAPTTENPDLPWQDLPIADTDGTGFGVGWYIDLAAGRAANDGAKNFWLTRKLPIRCGTTTLLAPGSAYLPSGDWQIRVRTFDYGHPFPNSTNVNPWISPFHLPPLLDMTYSYTPDTFPATNTSPWSTPVSVSISAQVPKPVPVSPINAAAVVVGAPITLAWQYRNTYAPPFAQAKRTLQVRRLNDAAWTTILNADASSSTSYTVPPEAFEFVSGNPYQWRVFVEDTTGKQSDYSAPATFWIVPLPASGEVIPDPSSTIDGATLGCGTHRVMIYRRGGKVHVGEIRGISSLEWNRVRDDISTAKIVVNDYDVDCGNLLARLDAWAYEVVIYRDNGYSTDRVWEGPITLLTYQRGEVTIQAKDVMGYLYRRNIREKFSDVANGDRVTSRAARIIQHCFAPDDPNVLSYLHVLAQPDDPMEYRSTPAMSRTGFEEVDDMAANAGLDYTAVGRSILLWATKHRIGTLPEFKDEDLGNSPIVSVYGMSMANVYVVSDGNGIWGEANRLNSEGQDPTYGLVEMLSSTWASDSTSETGTYTEEGLNTVRESFAESAERSIASRYPVPVVVRVPDGTRVNPDTVISIQHLVPGVVIPLRSTGTLREVVASQKLDAVKVTEVAGEETITVTMSPFSRDDNAVEGVEE